MSADLLLRAALEAIHIGDTAVLRQVLDRLPINTLEVRAADDLLVRLITTCAKYDRVEVAQMVLGYFDELNTQDGQPSAQVYLFLLPQVEEATLRFLARNIEDTTFVECVQDLIAYDASEATRMATQRLIDAYGIDGSKANILNQLYLEAEPTELNAGNPAVAEVLYENYVRVAPFAPLPPWMGNFTDLPDLPYEDEIELPPVTTPLLQLPETIEAQAEFLLGGLHDIGIAVDDIEIARQQTLELLFQLTAEDRMTLLKPALINNTRKYLASDVELFRILGPANALYGADLSDNTHPCMKYGGCRMFTCIHTAVLDDDEDSHYEEADWFTGHCEFCRLRLRNRYHAVRKPLAHGAWDGCFCSWKCVRESFTEPALGEFTIIDSLETQLHALGIQDRLLRGEVREVLTTTGDTMVDLGEGEDDTDALVRDTAALDLMAGPAPEEGL